MTTIFAKSALLAEGWRERVAVGIGGDGRIAAIRAGAAPGAGDLAVDHLLPAPANLHSHAFQRAMAGLTERRSPDAGDDFWSWRAVMYRFLARLAPEDVLAVTALAQMEMLEAGYAASAEFHYLHHRPDGAPYDDPAELSRAVAAAAAASGIGLTLLPVHYAVGGLDGRPLQGGQKRFRTDLDGFARIHEGAAAALRALPADARLGLAPHSLRAVPAADLAPLIALGRDGPIHIHVAEQTGEVAEVLAATGARPVDWLLDHAPVDARWCLVHATHMTATETRRLAASGAVAGLCPITEANLGDGTFAAARYLAAGGRLGIGSDSNVRVALAEELRGLEYSQRLSQRRRAVLATPERSVGRTLLEAACAGGAAALGRESGAIAAGRQADLLALDGGALDLDGLAGDALLDAWIFAGDDRLVTDVWAAGRHLVQGGRHIRRAAIEARYRKAMAKLREAL